MMWFRLFKHEQVASAVIEVGPVLYKIAERGYTRVFNERC